MRAARLPPPPEVLPGTRLGAYEVEAKLGRGGFGTVYRVRREGRHYAAKLVRLDELGPWGEREVRVLSRVRHPNAARLLESWHWPEQQPRFLVILMEYVEGPRLDSWARLENPSARQVLRVVLGVARALAAVHQARVLHRDIKEPNILVRQADGEAVLVDFGVGTCLDTSRPTRPSRSWPPGTRHYLAPEALRFQREQACDRQARFLSTPAGDMYALGVVLYWLLTDTLPFVLEEFGDIDRVLREPLQPPRQRNGRVPVELEALCLALMARRPEERPLAPAVCSRVEELLTRQGPDWDEPLCEVLSAHNITTVPGPEAEVDEEARWVREGEGAGRKPRRGRRPPARGEESPSAGPPAPRPAPAPPLARPPLAPAPPAGAPAMKPPGPGPRWRLVLAAGLALGLSVAGWGSLGPLVARDDEPPSPAGRGWDEEGAWKGWEGGWKVAPPWRAPEAGGPGSAMLEGAPPTPGARAAPPSEEESIVKKPQKKPHSPASAARTLAAVASTCAALGCAGGPQVRPPPPPPPPAEPCPPGAVETMEKLGIYITQRFDSSLFLTTGQSSQPTPVTEGWTHLRMLDDLGSLDSLGLTVSGRLTIGERAHVRITQARTRQGDTYPVCLEGWDSGGGVGLGIFSHEGPGTVRVWSLVKLQAVRRFE